MDSSSQTGQQEQKQAPPQVVSDKPVQEQGVTQPSDQTIASPVQQASSQQVSVTSGGKEGAPMVTAPVVPQETVSASLPEVVIPQEVQPIVEKSPETDKPEVDNAAEQAGVSLAKESAPIPASATASIKLPMTYEEAILKKKNSKFRQSIKWLAAVIEYQWKKLNPNLYK